MTPYGGTCVCSLLRLPPCKLGIKKPRSCVGVELWVGLRVGNGFEGGGMSAPLGVKTTIGVKGVQGLMLDSGG